MQCVDVHILPETSSWRTFFLQFQSAVEMGVARVVLTLCSRGPCIFNVKISPTYNFEQGRSFKFRLYREKQLFARLVIKLRECWPSDTREVLFLRRKEVWRNRSVVQSVRGLFYIILYKIVWQRNASLGTLANTCDIALGHGLDFVTSFFSWRSQRRNFQFCPSL